jgi:hypothetical protein
LYGLSRGLAASRQSDSAGVGWSMNGINLDLEYQVRRDTGGLLDAQNEQGMEVFYDDALTPAIRTIPSDQHTWNPLTAASACRATSATTSSSPEARVSSAGLAAAAPGPTRASA